MPDEARGRIFSLTEKRLISVAGDGERTLEELILDDPRAVCMAPRFLAPLRRAPGRGARGAASRCGWSTWARTARGRSSSTPARHRTPALEAAIDRLAQSLPGFYFGRFDVRVPSLDDLRAGRGIRVLELNGLTAEATHVYDPANGLVRGVPRAVRAVGARVRDRRAEPRARRRAGEPGRAARAARAPQAPPAPRRVTTRPSARATCAPRGGASMKAVAVAPEDQDPGADRPRRAAASSARATCWCASSTWACAAPTARSAPSTTARRPPARITW